VREAVKVGNPQAVCANSGAVVRKKVRCQGRKEAGSGGGRWFKEIAQAGMVAQACHRTSHW